VEQELQAAYDDALPRPAGKYPLLLISRRMKNTYNSTGPELSLLKTKGTTNPAYVNSQVLEELGITDGELIEAQSRHGAIPAIAAASDDIKPGVESMSHCWGGSPDPKDNCDEKIREIGSNTNRLIDNLESSEKYSGMPRQSSIPVALRKF
jgi:anaerobic selenocysteine-containing dehydrogenase